MNTFYHGDCLFVLKRDVDPESVDLIYLDPPFFTGKVQKGKWKGEWHPEAMEISFEDSKSYWAKHLEVMRQKAPIWLSDIGSKYPEFGAYLYYMMIRLQACYRVLKQTGSIYLHCDWRASHYLKVVMDDILRDQNFQNEIIWNYGARGTVRRIGFPRRHHVLLYYTKSDKFVCNPIYRPYKDPGLGRYNKIDEQGRRYALIKRIRSATGEVYYGRTYPKKEGAPMTDVWDIPLPAATSKEWLGYPTQKPEALLERVIIASSNEGDLVLDPFCGCGTTAIVASKLNRQFIGIDIHPTAFSAVKNRSHELFSQAQYISRDLKEVQEMSHKEFETWVNEFYKASKPSPDRGVDGITTADGVPIQTKTFEVGYEVIDKLLTSSRYHPLVPKPIKKIIVVSQIGFDDSATKRKFQIEHTEGIEVCLTTPEEMLRLED